MDSRGAQGVQIGSGNVQHNHYGADPTETSASSGVDVIEVSIAPAEVAESFDVHVLQSPTGQASVQVKLDVRGLTGRQRELQQALLASTVQTRRAVPTVERTIQDVGRVLFTALLGTGDVVASYRAARGLADARGHRLHIVLRVDDPALAALPWEMMYDPLVDTYVCRREQLVRTVPVRTACAPGEASLPIRILAVDASPPGMPGLDLPGERAVLSQALKNGIASGRIELSWVPRATWAELQERLLDGEWHVVHFFGHGGFDPARDEGFLVLAGEDGRPDRVEAGRLADLLREARPIPPVVVLNACQSGVPGIVDAFSGTATTLVQHGIATVAAMQYEISDDAAIAFARAFYSSLARGRTVDEAVLSGRVGILGTGSQTLEWITPVLYARDQRTAPFAVRTLGPAITETATAATMRREPPGTAPDTTALTVPASTSQPPPPSYPPPPPPAGWSVPVPSWGTPQPEVARTGTHHGLGPVTPGAVRHLSRRTGFQIAEGAGKRLTLVCSLLFAFSPLLTCVFGAPFAFGLAAVFVPRMHRWEMLLLRTGAAVLSLGLATFFIFSGKRWSSFSGASPLSQSALFVVVVGGVLLSIVIVVCSMATGFLTPAGQAARQENALRDSDPMARAALVSALLGSLMLPILPAIVLAIVAVNRSCDQKLVGLGHRVRTTRYLAVYALAISVLWIVTWSLTTEIDASVKP
ncbi:MAG: hypothetical protein QG622_66 [Actinomycetota bacterium]|nr:hypothetical protein [Actinomycetota bacterium]